MIKTLYYTLITSALILAVPGVSGAQSAAESADIAEARVSSAIESNTSTANAAVDLASFTSRVRKGKVLLEWHTADETEDYGFEIQRNARGEWRSIGYVAAHGTEKTAYGYSFSDLRPPASETIEYRLKQVHEDGYTTYSSALEAHFNITKDLPSLVGNYPNPCSGPTSIAYSLPTSSSVTVKVYDLRGKLVKELVNRYQQAGNYSVVYNTAGMPAGQYMIELGTSRGIDAKRLTITR